MANKLEKKLSAIVCLGVVVADNQMKKSSPSYTKILRRFDKALDDCREALPSYPQKEIDQIKRMTLNYAGRVFGGDSHPSELYTSLLLAMVEDALDSLTDTKRLAVFERLHSALRQMHRYWDGRLDKPHYYERASEAFELWKWCY
jgi:hypothetical protein